MGLKAVTCRVQGLQPFVRPALLRSVPLLALSAFMRRYFAQTTKKSITNWLKPLRTLHVLHCCKICF